MFSLRSCRVCFQVIFQNMSKKCKMEVPKAGLAKKASEEGVSLKDRKTNFPDITFLPSPNKSESDKKEYTTIQLANGLTAVIVSDTPNLIDLDEEAAGSETGSELSSEESEGESDTSENSVESNSSSCKKSTEEKLAACSLTVGVGSFSDPPDIPGLAHFLEHMVFMGSTQYPKENEFESYITKTGGSDNASTECEYTTFYFEAPEKHLYHGMNMFAQFFTSPLMLKDAMNREREAIDSEFKIAQPSDPYRKQQLISGMAHPDNPVRKFMWGNLKTLKEDVDDDYLYNCVHEFRKRHYSAHRMTFAVQARLPTQTLIKWVNDCFSHIQNNQLPPLEFPMPQEPFNKDLFPKMYYVESVKEMCEITVNWIMPSVLFRYLSKPTEYFSWLLGHEGKGSFAAYLRKNSWALDVVAGYEEDGCSNNSLFTMFSITVLLSELGDKHTDKVLHALFSYINLIKSIGPVERIFREIQCVQEMKFKYSTEISAVENVEGLSESMQIFDPEHYMDGNELMFDYNPDEIKHFMSYLMPSSANIIISNKLHTIDLDKQEPWFGTKYAMRDIPPELIKEWETVKPYPEFKLPEPNIFITKDFSLLPIKHPDQKYPEKIRSDEKMEVWYKQDNKFRLPTCWVQFHLLIPGLLESPIFSALMDMYVTYLKQVLCEELYPASTAQLQYNVISSSKGLCICLYGLNEKLPVLLETLLKNVSTFKSQLNSETFEEMKKIQKRCYINYNLKGSALARELRMGALVDPYFSTLEKYSKVESVTLNDLESFCDNVFKEVYIQCLAQGNLSEETALSMADMVYSLLGCETKISPSDHVQIKVHKINRGEVCLRVSAFNEDDKTSYTLNLFQWETGSVVLQAKIDLLLMLMEEPLFDKLRTQEQLGYDVSCRARVTFGVMGVTISVNSRTEKHNVDFVNSRISEFLTNFLDELKNMDEDEFEHVKDSLIRLKQCCDLHVQEEAQRNWAEIIDKHYLFDRIEKEIEYLKTFTKDDVIETFKKYLLPDGDGYKKLNVQIVGHVKDSSAENEISQADGLGDGTKLTLLDKDLSYKFTLEGDNKPEGYFTTIEKFKQGREFYPVITFNK